MNEENSNNDKNIGVDVVYFKNINELNLSKELLFQKIETKFNLFENCLNEVGLYKSYPYFDFRRYKFLSFLNFNFGKYPIDNTEEILMRNCVKRNLIQLQKIKNYLNKDEEHVTILPNLISDTGRKYLDFVIKISPEED
jgi:hypothetical protein